MPFKALPAGNGYVEKNLGELDMAEALLSFQSCPAACAAGAGRLKAAENLIFQSKNRFLAVFAPGNLKDFSKNW